MTRGVHREHRRAGGRREAVARALSVMELLVPLALAMLVAPVGSEAQPRTTLPRVGVLEPGAPQIAADAGTCHHGFRQGLRDLGYVEGQNVVFEFRYAEGQLTRLPSLAAELVRLTPDVIWTHSTDAI